MKLDVGWDLRSCDALSTKQGHALLYCSTDGSIHSIRNCTRPPDTASYVGEVSTVRSRRHRVHPIIDYIYANHR
jgi:hypothetical protein